MAMEETNPEEEKETEEEQDEDYYWQPSQQSGEEPRDEARGPGWLVELVLDAETHLRRTS